MTETTETQSHHAEIPPHFVCQLQEHLKMGQREMGELLGASHSTISRWQNRVNEPNEQHVKALRFVGEYLQLWGHVPPPNTVKLAVEGVVPRGRLLTPAPEESPALESPKEPSASPRDRLGAGLIACTLLVLGWLLYRFHQDQGLSNLWDYLF